MLSRMEGIQKILLETNIKPFVYLQPWVWPNNLSFKNISFMKWYQSLYNQMV